MIHNVVHPLYASEKLTDEQLKPLWQEVNYIKSIMENDDSSLNDARKNLAGNISKEYGLSPQAIEYVETLLFPLVQEFAAERNIHRGEIWSDAAIRLKTLWVNFSKKHEFNPPHHHGGLLSFVIWLSIPYNIEDEMNVESVKHSRAPMAGKFSFYYTSPSEIITPHVIDVDRKMNGTVALFPSELKHEVFPFYTSDDYRITLSGNFYYEN
jgi:hypothetical protein